MSIHHEATGIILKKLRTKNDDKTVVLFSQEFGKLFLVAKGAQKITSRRLSSLDSLNVVHIQFTEHHSFYYIREVDVVSRLQTIKDDYSKRRLLLLFAEVLDKLLPLNQREDHIFEECMGFLRKLGKGTAHTDTIVCNIYQLLLLFGYSHGQERETVTMAQLQKLLEQVTEREIKSWRLS